MRRAQRRQCAPRSPRGPGGHNRPDLCLETRQRRLSRKGRFLATTDVDDRETRGSWRLLMDPVFGPLFLGRLVATSGVWISNIVSAILAFGAVRFCAHSRGGQRSSVRSATPLRTLERSHRRSGQSQGAAGSRTHDRRSRFGFLGPRRVDQRGRRPAGCLGCRRRGRSGGNRLRYRSAGHERSPPVSRTSRRTAHCDRSRQPPAFPCPGGRSRDWRPCCHDGRTGRCARRGSRGQPGICPHHCFLADAVVETRPWQGSKCPRRSQVRARPSGDREAACRGHRNRDWRRSCHHAQPVPSG